MNVYKNIDENIAEVESTFNNCGDFVGRKFPIGKDKDIWLYVFYIDMMTNRETIDSNIMLRLMIQADYRITQESCGIYEALKECGISTAEIKDTDNFNEIFVSVLSGDTVLFADGSDKAMIISTRGFPGRGVQGTETEVVVQGSKEAFSESLRVNTALIRRRIRDTKLKILQTRVGRRSQTDVALVYIDDIVKPDILKDAAERIRNVNIDAIMDSGCLEQLIESNYLTPFPQAQTTERPDKAAAAILEGRIVIIADNSPFVLIIPTTLNSFFQSSEDYYQRWHIVSFVRVIRYIAGLISITLPGLYIATAVYHPSMLPMLLVFKMAGARQTVPFPAVVEILIMELAFELLREAGIRLPKAVGSTIGIVGGLIIGSAAVEAGLVSPIVVIVAALTGIAGFAVPHVTLVSGFRLVKYLFIVLSAALGLFGFWSAAIILLIHLVSLKSFGIPYLFPYATGEINGYEDFKDSIFRFPTRKLKKRPIYANTSQRRRVGGFSERTERHD